MEKGANITDIEEKVKSLGLEDNIVLTSEIKMAPRICIDLENNNRIVSVYPLNLSINFMNSSIQTLAASIISYWKNLSPLNDSGGLEILKEELQVIDPKSLENDDNIWSIIMEELKLDEEGY